MCELYIMSIYAAACLPQSCFFDVSGRRKQQQNSRTTIITRLINRRCPTKPGARSHQAKAKNLAAQRLLMDKNFMKTSRSYSFQRASCAPFVVLHSAPRNNGDAAPPLEDLRPRPTATTASRRPLMCSRASLLLVSCIRTTLESVGSTSAKKWIEDNRDVVLSHKRPADISLCRSYRSQDPFYP